MRKIPTKAKAMFGDREIHERTLQADWARSSATYTAAVALIDGVDHTTAQIERRWGIGRLRLLVDDTLRLKFDRQRVKWGEAVKHGTYPDVVEQAPRTKAAYVALDRAATAQGHEPCNVDVWEVLMPDGSVTAIVKTNADASLVHSQSDRKLTVYTLDEIACLLAGFPTIAKAKECFPGALVADVRMKDAGDPLNGLPDDDENDPLSQYRGPKLGKDELPF